MQKRVHSASFKKAKATLKAIRRARLFDWKRDLMQYTQPGIPETIK